jgi:hypothetical protein
VLGGEALVHVGERGVAQVARASVQIRLAHGHLVVADAARVVDIACAAFLIIS